MRVEDARAYAESMICDGGHLMPVFIGTDKAGTEHVLVAPWRNDTEKENILMMMRIYFTAHEIDRYMLISETWLQTVPIADLHKPRPQPKDDDNRTEAVMVIDVPRVGPTQGHNFPIKRFGEKATLLDNPYDKPVEIQGAMTDLLMKKVPTPEDVAAAKKICEQFDLNELAKTFSPEDVRRGKYE